MLLMLYEFGGQSSLLALFKPMRRKIKKRNVLVKTILNQREEFFLLINATSLSIAVDGCMQLS